METSNEKQVAIKKAAPLPSSILFESDAHAGFENVKHTSVALPILKLLQNGSAEGQKRNQAYIEGAEPGMPGMMGEKGSIGDSGLPASKGDIGNNGF